MRIEDALGDGGTSSAAAERAPSAAACATSVVQLTSLTSVLLAGAFERFGGMPDGPVRLWVVYIGFPACADGFGVP